MRGSEPGNGLEEMLKYRVGKEVKGVCSKNCEGEDQREAREREVGEKEYGITKELEEHDNGDKIEVEQMRK